MEFCTRVANELMLKEIQKGSGKNVLSSPLSINAVLNMVVTGTTGDTLKLMLGFLGSESVDEIKSKSTRIAALLRECRQSSKRDYGGGFIRDDGLILTMISGAWVDQRFPLVPEYEEVLKGIFKSEANNVDFKTKADQVVDEINSWANIASRGLIKNILQYGSVPTETTLILANVLYFQGFWHGGRKFDEQMTENRKFYLLNGDNVSVPFMTNNSKYCHYGSFDGFKVLEIPYVSDQANKFAMYFFLPDERDGLQTLLGKFQSGSGFLNEEYFKLTHVRLGEFWIPKFKFSFDFDVSGIMDDIGESSSIIKNPRDLSEMVHNSEDVPFFILKMFQKAYIEVDERGTKAVATTLLSLVGGGEIPPQNLSFVADHPFVFMIREVRSGLVLFTGAVINPIRED
ncbi:serpin-ZX-like [Rhododendron vialii]|uniref:serpin-ZX-like n=1 Tax=Rhododendron vialii TaxID=182163 RepID=UPI00265EDC03|nr:serpin-ZX-like [Rhododendron vialii]